VFGEENAVILNDDKPAIRLVDGRFMVYGTPFSGKTDCSRNQSVPLQGVSILQRAPQNTIERLPSRAALLPLLNQTLRPSDEGQMDKLLSLLDTFFRQVPVFQLGCTISEAAVKIAYTAMKESTQ
jgi:hypothetical protein